MFSLRGKTALVTGGSRGIGRSIAIALADAGADVVVNYLRNEALARDVVHEVKNRGQRACAVGADIGDPVQVDALFGNVRAEFGVLDILVNNAGVAEISTLFQTDLEMWNRSIRTNLTGAFLCAQAAAAMMRERGGGRIISISSVAAEAGAALGHAHYAAAKSGLFGLSRTLALTLAPFGITSNVVVPGLIETELLRVTHPDEVRREMGEKLPLGIGTPEDVAYTVVFLASDEARYVTGTSIDVNGGMHIR